MVTFLVRGKGTVFHVSDIFLESFSHGFSQFRIPADKPRLKKIKETEHVLSDEYLTIAVNTSTDTNGRNGYRFRHFFGQDGRDLFQNDGKNARLFQQIMNRLKLLEMARPNEIMLKLVTYAMLWSIL